MSAFGYTKYGVAFGVAVRDAGTRISDKLMEATDRLATALFELGTCKGIEVNYQFLYPFVGGTQVSHSFNLADPKSKRIQFEDDTTVTHNQFGIIGPGNVELFGFDGTIIDNETGAMAPPTVAQCCCAYGIYCRSGVSADEVDFMANQITPVNTAHGIVCRRATYGDMVFWNGVNSASGYIVVATANPQGFYCSMRNTATPNTDAYKNGVRVGGLTTGQAANTAKFYLFRGSSHNYAFCYLSRDFGVNGLPYSSAALQAPMYAIVQKFQTWCGRQV